VPPLLDLVVPIRVRRVDRVTVSETKTDGAASHGAGFEAGYETGRLRAEWEAGRKRDEERIRVHALVTKLENIHREYEKLLEEHMPELIQAALARVFRKHPFTGEEIAAEIAVLVREMEQAGRIALECAPAEADDLRRQLEECASIPSGVRWTLTSNATLGSGEFLLKSDLGTVDGRHASRVRQVYLALEGAA
jgi:flagellar biosynthesis/type III secretory pathway protein FliH